MHKSPENAAYTAAYAKAYPKDRPNFMSVAGYDGMQLIAEVMKKTGGNADGDKFIEAAKGMSWTSPRGKITIDPATRDIVQTVYIRKVEKVDGKLQNVEFDSVARRQGSRQAVIGRRLSERLSDRLGERRGERLIER